MTEVKRDPLESKYPELLSLLDNIEASFKRDFPDAWFKGSVQNLLGDPSICIKFGLVPVDHKINHIAMNDPVYHSFLISPKGSDCFVSENYQGRISVNPKKSYLAMSSIKTPYRKTTGERARVLKSFVTFFSRLKTLVQEHESDIYQRAKYEDKYLQLA
jgi:hypothetical protein